MAKPPLSIPDSELDVLKVLWERGQATVRDVLETLKAAGHTGEKGQPWSYATVATLLDRLETKKVIESDRTDQAFSYRPIVSVREVQQKRVESLVDKLYQGEPGLLVLHLLKSHPLDSEHAREVRALLEQMNSGTAPAPSPKKGPGPSH
jgi:BlaI family penicillinase repressor